MISMQFMRVKKPVAVCAFLLTAFAAFGQINSGSLAGTVTDPQGEVVSGAVVTIVDAQSGTTYTATTSGAGLYVIPEVRPGTYTETVTAPGFETVSTSRIIVSISTRAAEDV